MDMVGPGIERSLMTLSSAIGASTLNDRYEALAWSQHRPPQVEQCGAPDLSRTLGPKNQIFIEKKAFYHMMNIVKLPKQQQDHSHKV